MMEGPDEVRQMQKQREFELLQPKKVEDKTPPTLQALRRVLRGVWWEYHKRHLDIIELVAPSERQHSLARNQMLRHINEGEEVMVRSLFMVFGQEPPADLGRAAKAARKEKEQK